MLYRCAYNDCSLFLVAREVNETDSQPVDPTAILCAGQKANGHRCGRILDRLPNGEDSPFEHVPSESPAPPAPPTAEEIAAVEAQEAAQAEVLANETDLREQLRTRMAQLRTARQAIANGNLFAGLTNPERNVIDGLLQNDIAIARLLARVLDGTD